jgi:hypothetical protein
MPEDYRDSRLQKLAHRSPTDEPQSNPVPSKATLEEVRALFERYADETAADVELSSGSKGMYIDFAECFVRWMHGEFRPGSRGGSLRSIRKSVTRAGILSKEVRQTRFDEQ